MTPSQKKELLKLIENYADQREHMCRAEEYGYEAFHQVELDIEKSKKELIDYIEYLYEDN